MCCLVVLLLGLLLGLPAGDSESQHGLSHPPVVIRYGSTPLVRVTRALCPLDQGRQCRQGVALELTFYLSGAVPLFRYHVTVKEPLSGQYEETAFWLEDASGSEEVTVSFRSLPEQTQDAFRFIITVRDDFLGLDSDESFVAFSDVTFVATSRSDADGGAQSEREREDAEASDRVLTHRETQRRVRVAVCFAGAWRRWEDSWRTLRPNLVDALDADVFAVSDDDPGGINGRDASAVNTSLTLQALRAQFGARLKGAHHFSARDMQNLDQHTFAEVVAAQKAGLYMFPYYLKIWKCGQLIHEHVRHTGTAYDVVVRLRPDLTILDKWHVRATTETATFRLFVGPSCVEFGPRDVVVPASTMFCYNDWLQVGSYGAMTVHMDMVHTHTHTQLRFTTAHAAYLSPDAREDHSFLRMSEVHGYWLAWRTGRFDDVTMNMMM